MLSIANKLALLAVIWLSCQIAHAQQREQQYRIVEGFAVHGYDEKDLEIGYEWYDTEEKALRAKANMEKLQTATGKYYARVEITPEKRRIPLVQGEKLAPPPEVNLPPALGQRVPLKKSDYVKDAEISQATSLLRGRKGKGKFGANSIAIEFNESGQFTMSGNLSGKGTWNESGGTAISMELRTASFRGSLNGNKLSGVWFSKNPKQLLREFKMVIELVPKLEKNLPLNVQGTAWKVKVTKSTSNQYESGYFHQYMELEFRVGGEIWIKNYYSTGDPPTSMRMIWKWKQNGSEITFDNHYVEEDPNSRSEFIGSLKGERMEGTFSYKYPKVNVFPPVTETLVLEKTKAK